MKGRERKMRKKLPVILGVAGFVLVLGAEGDAFCGTGSYILARAVIGGVMMIGGWAWWKIREGRRDYEIDH